MNNSIINTFYADAYLNLLQNYVNEYRGIYCHYYQMNKQQSSYDSTLIANGSYERVGKLSGLRFNKIYNLIIPVTEGITPILNATEQGVVVDFKTSFLLPNYGFQPSMYDFLTFVSNNNVLLPLFQIVNFSLAYLQTALTFYKCDIMGVGIPISTIDNYVVENYAVNGINNKIYPLDINNTLLQGQTLINQVTDQILTTIDSYTNIAFLNI